MSAKIDHIRNALAGLRPGYLDVADESHLHSRGLETHYRAVVVSSTFSALRPVQRHQQVYHALGALMGGIHALALHAYTPEEWAQVATAPASPRCRGGSKHDRIAAAA